MTAEAVLNGMPTDMWNLYRSWVEANPSKVNRLVELVNETCGAFREAVTAQGAVALDPDAGAIPATGFRHALNLVVFNLGMEMGVQFAPEVYSLNIQANIWLRMVQTGQLVPVGGSAGRTPSYQVRRELS